MKRTLAEGAQVVGGRRYGSDRHEALRRSLAGAGVRERP
jgi:hypothetical protein